MAFSFANVASEAAGIGGGSAQSGVQIQEGAELKEIQTGQLGFRTINGDAKVKLLPTPWPSEELPLASAQLLSVASSQGILAAAGPDALVIASTDGVREALKAKEGGDIKNVVPIVSIPHDRLTQVAFSSDESVLVVSGPHSGGLTAYKVDELKSGNGEPALRIHTTTPLRALVPNPNPSTAHLFAIVNGNGDLSIADLSKGQLIEGPDGTVLSTSVTCVSWSNRGKQLVAGNAAGTAVQLKQNGQVVAHIPRSTSIPEENHMSAISWLEDDTFLTIYTPNTDDDIPPSEFYIIERSNKTNFMFHKLPEVVPPFGLKRLPTHHFIARLRKFDPHITDLILLAATSGTDIGIISKSNQPLSSSDAPEELVSNTFTTTTLEDDTRRAALPLSEEALDTSPIGMCIDLSSKEAVINPLPSDPEIQETSGPVPNLLVLNNEGLICSWWVIYSDSIKQKTTFSGFDSLKTTKEIRSAVSPPAEGESMSETPHTESILNQPASSSTSTFLQASNTASPSTFGSPAPQSTFSAPKLTSPLSTFGTGSNFGIASKIGDEKSSWTSTGFGANKNTNTNTSDSGSAFGQPGFGQSSFGTPSAMSSTNTPAFGSTSAFGNRAPGFGQPATPAFGKTGFGSGSGSTASPFGIAGGVKSGAGFGSFANPNAFGTNSDMQDKKGSPFANVAGKDGFASFAKSSGFGAASEKKDEIKGNTFTPATSSGFGAFSTSNSQSPWAATTGSGSFAADSSGNGFGKKQGFGGSEGTTDQMSKNKFGSGTPFKIDSSFKGDGTAKDDLPKPTGGSNFGFGAGLGSLLNDTQGSVSPTRNTESEMGDGGDNNSVSSIENERPFTGFSLEAKIPEAPAAKQFTTPPSTINQPKTTPLPPLSGLFGGLQHQTTTPQQPLTGFKFPSTTPNETPGASQPLFITKPISVSTPAAVQRSEPVKSFGSTEDVQTPRAKEEKDLKKGEEPRQITTETSNEDAISTNSMPAAPLPPDPVSKPGYTTGDTSSANSKESKEPEDAPLPPDFVPANRSATKAAEEAQLPDDEHSDDEEEFSSDFEDSGDDIAEDAEDDEDHDDEDATTEQLQTSPESSFKGGDTVSPTDGLFTKVSANDISKPTRPLFGEVSHAAPVFAPPKPQQSPRSPSPVRPFVSHDSLRSDNRSVSAPVRSGSAINQRKVDYSRSAIAAQAARAHDDEAAREKTRRAALKSVSEKAKAEEVQILEDNEDDRIQRELALPVEPSDSLDEFITYQAGAQLESSKADIPAQIERLYQDINSMVYTTGINARSLSAFMMHQRSQTSNSNWVAVLHSEAPMDALNADWSLNDINQLYDGSATLANDLDRHQVQGVPQKLESCQTLLTRDLSDLRAKLITIRRSIHSRTRGSPSAAPLSAEQASIQHDLRRASTLVQAKLGQIEDTLAVMRARLAELTPQTDIGKGSGMSGSQVVQKKPTVEAVTNTILKMTSMAEKKSADIDVLEAQLRKIDPSLDVSVTSNGERSQITTPRRSRTNQASTPGSSTSSVFYTPDSKVGASARSTRSTGGHKLFSVAASAEDKERWQARASRKQNVAATLKAVLEGKRKTSG